MLRVRNIQLRNCDQPSIEFDDFSTELHSCDFDKVSGLLTILAEELAIDHYCFNVGRGGLALEENYD